MRVAVGEDQTRVCWVGFIMAVVLTGSHGAGDPSETLTPLVAWGAGVRSAEYINPPLPTQHSPQGITSLMCCYIK